MRDVERGPHQRQGQGRDEAKKVSVSAKTVDLQFSWKAPTGTEKEAPIQWLDESLGIQNHSIAVALSADQDEELEDGASKPKTGPLWEELSDHEKLQVIAQRMKQGLEIVCKHSVAAGGTGRAVVPPADTESVLDPPCCAATKAMDPKLLEGPLPINTLNLKAMAEDLRTFYDAGLVGALARGIVVGYLGPRDSVIDQDNLPSAGTAEGRVAVERLLAKDIAGLPTPGPNPQSVPNIVHVGTTADEARAALHQRYPNVITGEWLQTHPIGVVLPRLGYKTKARVVDDMSYRGEGVNEFVFHVALPCLRMITHETIVASYRRLRAKHPEAAIKAYLIDIKSYFKNMATSIEDWPLATFKVTNEKGNSDYYVRTKCGFGARCYPAMSSRISAALVYTLSVKDGVGNAFMFIDDLGVLAADIGDELEVIEAKVLARLARWNLPLAIEKIQPWAEVRRILGIQYDFRLGNPMQSVPKDRQDRMLMYLRAIKPGTRIGVKQITSLYHSLLSILRIAVQGRHYLSEMSRLCSYARRQQKSFFPTSDLIIEVDWWTDCLKANQGVPLASSLDEPPVIKEDVALRGSGGHEGATDASGSGVGGVFGNEYFVWDWNPTELKVIGNLSEAAATVELRAHKITIAAMEFHALLAGVAIWGPNKWQGRHLELRCDNQLVCHVIETGRVRSSVVLARYLRLWHDLLHTHRMTATVTYISTHDNTLPDVLSRAGSGEEFRKLTGGTMTRVYPPQDFRGLLLSISKASSLREATLIPRRRAGRVAITG